MSLLVGLSGLGQAQVNVTTHHNDNARTGTNSSETILNPSNVNSTQFGKLYSVPMDGAVFAQPLILSGVSIAGGTHNVVYAVTQHDSVYAIDGDTGTVYSKLSLIPAGGSTISSLIDLGCSDLIPEIGITGTPVIDSQTGTLYLISKSKVNGVVNQYLHALDVATLAEKFNGPVVINGSVAGTGVDSVGGVVTFNPLLENQRSGLLLENGHVVIGWGSHCDGKQWHGWMMSYNATTLQQEAVFNTSPNDNANGIWMSGGGPAADTAGNIYVPTGNGTWNGVSDWGDTVLKLGAPANGTFPVLDYFTPFNQVTLGANDEDVSSGGIMLLPPLTTGTKLLAQQGKNGTIYILDTTNLGKYCGAFATPCTDHDPQVQEILQASSGIWGSPAYWNGNLYWTGANDQIHAYSFNSSTGAVSTSPTQRSAQYFAYSAPTPSISSNGNTNGILWALDGSAPDSTCDGGTTNCLGLYAYDATNLSNLLYISSQAANNRDDPGTAIKFETPIIANGKVYVGTQNSLTAYGLLSSLPTAAAAPTFTPASGSYTGTQSVTIADATPGAAIYYTTNGVTPTASSALYKAALSVSSTVTIKAIAIASGYSASPVTSATYTFATSGTAPVINDPSGFASSAGFNFVGGSALSGTALALTDGGSFEGRAIWYGTPVNVQNFTADFSFQVTPASPDVADGFTFTLQNAGPNAVGSTGSGLGYQGIATSVAIKFDLYNSAGEGNDSTGFYVNGAAPTLPATDMTASGVNLHSGNILQAHITYNGTTLTLTVTDTVTNASFTTSTAINIPTTVGASTAYAGFTAGSGGLSATQQILTWTYSTGTTTATAATPTFTPAAGTYTSTQSVSIADTTAGAAIYYTVNGTTPTTASTLYSAPISVSATQTVKALAVASGYTNSAVASATYTIGTTPVAATPTFTPVAGTYTSAQSVSIADTTAGAAIYYTVNGTTPTTASTLYNAPISVSATQTIKALAVASGYTNSAVASAAYTISTGGSGTGAVINAPSGFSSSTGFNFVSGAVLTGSALGLTDGGGFEARAVWYATPVNVQNFTTDFSFQVTPADPNAADGFTFTLQNVGANAVGSAGSGLGYQGLATSVAIKFDLYNSAGEGGDSTGFYVNGAAPTLPATDMTASGVNLHSGNILQAHITYNGTTLTLTVTDTVTNASFTTSTAINIPTTVGASTAYAGFTAGSGGLSSTQQILTWTYSTGATTPTAATPTFTPVAGTYTSAQSVSVADTTAGAAIYYTVNGTTPTTASTLYSAPISVSATQTVKALAVASGYTNSAVASATYTISTTPVAATPTFTPAAGTYTGTQSVSIADTTAGAAIYYTVNGTTPTTASTLYSGAILVGATQTIKALAVASGYTNSAVASAAYTISTAPVVAATPIFTPAAGTYTGTQSVSIADSTAGAAIYYTINGTTPTTASALYSGPIAVTASRTLKAIATATGYTNSAVASAAYTINAVPVAATPTFTPAAGSYTGTQSVTIADTTAGTAIYYTVDGTTPTTASTLYSGAIAVSSSRTLKAIATATGFTNSAVASAAYTINAVPVAATPTFTPAAGSYTGTQSVTISDSTSGAAIYYTVNGATPTTSSTLYSGAISVSSSQTVKAIATATGFSTSAVASAAYTITTGGGGTGPVINAPSGFNSTAGLSFAGGAALAGTALGLTDGGYEARAVWYATPVNVQNFTTDFNFQITPADPNAADGFTFTLQNVGPNALGSGGSGLGYQGLATSVAIKFDLYNSAGEGGDSTGFYVNGAAPTLPATDMTASGVNLHSGNILQAHITYNGTTLTVTVTDTVTNASFTTSTAINIPTTVGANTAYAGFTAGTGGLSATQQILNWTYTTGAATPVAATPTFTPVAGTYTSAQSVSIADTTAGAAIYYTVNGTTPTTASTLYSAPISVSATQTVKAFAVASGYTNSAVASATYTISTPVAATPTFTPAAGTYTSTQSVSIADTTAGAAIYYTVNGTTPTTASTLYSAPISVSATQTVKALAVASGYTNSAVASATYTIGTTPVAATPTFTPVAGTYTSAQSVSIADTTAGAAIYYTVNGTTPTTASTLYNAPISVSATQTIKALAVASGYTNSAVASAAYTISTGGSGTGAVINAPSGFSSSTGFNFVSGAVLTGSALGLTDGGGFEARAVWYATPVNVQNFTTDFSFQVTPADPNAADGFTFTLQNVGANAVGSAGSGLGYQGLATSVAIKFDLYNSAGEGGDSTGFYVNGAAPTLPATDMTASGVNLHSGNILQAHITYNGTTLTLTVTDTVTNASFTTSTAINIPTTVGASTAYAGFTAGSGGLSSTQQILTWTYSN